MKNTLVEQAVNMVSETEKKTPLKEQSGATPTSAVMINGLRIENVVFCLDTGKEKYLFQTEDEAIEQLRKLDKKTINPDNSQIVSVNTTGNTWKLTPVPWSRIAIKLL
ncbi:MAG TPA: hypothetical protein VMT57_02300 [Candidatus Thermoplasmatota archaeon]|nr:hypothetical protein [Candidatus Thermoplasmatota archaeon]